MNHSNPDTMKWVELHCHTKLGSIGAVNIAAEIIKAAKEENMSAVAITDVGVAYAFPEAAEACKSLWSATAKECRANGMDPGAEPDFFKVIYGMETRLLRRHNAQVRTLLVQKRVRSDKRTAAEVIVLCGSSLLVGLVTRGKANEP